MMAKPKKNSSKKKAKKGKKPPLTTEKPAWHWHPNNFRTRQVDEKLLKRVEGFSWIPKRCYIGFDWEEGRMCVIIPELGLEGEMYRYMELNMVGEAAGHLLWGREIDEILKKAKKAGGRRRSLR
jgi:hypothetical protein